MRPSSSNGVDVGFHPRRVLALVGSPSSCCLLYTSGNTGHFSAVMGRYFTVFAWVGFDSPEAAVYEKKGVSAALAKTCFPVFMEIAAFLILM